MRYLLSILCLVLLAAPASAGIAEEVLASKEGKTPPAASAPAMKFCKDGEDFQACYGRFQDAFHDAMNGIRTLHQQCLSRMNRPIPDEVFTAFAATPEMNIQGQKVNLKKFIEIFLAENSASFSMCQLALFHELQDRLARAFGIDAPQQDYLKKFDESLKNGTMPH